MAVSLTDRLTQAIRIAEQSMQSAQFQSDYRNWHEVHRVLQDARDELSKPAFFDLIKDDPAVVPVVPLKRGPGRPRKEPLEAA